MSNDKIREEFEAWVLRSYPKQDMRRFSDGEYQSVTINHCWLAWGASREALVIELPPAPEVPEEPEEAIDDSHMDAYHSAIGMRHACSKFIEAAGLKVKP